MKTVSLSLGLFLNNCKEGLEGWRKLTKGLHFKFLELHRAYLAFWPSSSQLSYDMITFHCSCYYHCSLISFTLNHTLRNCHNKHSSSSLTTFSAQTVQDFRLSWSGLESDKTAGFLEAPRVLMLCWPLNLPSKSLWGPVDKGWGTLS